jgi:hypothetical protein
VIARELLRVNRLQVRAAGLDPLTVQLRAAQAVNAVEPQLPDCGPAAVLCIRRLRDPRPASLRLEGGGLPPARAWVDAVHQAIADLVRRAARPASGPVPSAAEAVLFADWAELLTCLLSDWLQGSTSVRWWWHSLFRAEELARLPLSLWRESPAYLPAVLHQLARKGLAVAYVRTLSAAEAGGLLKVVTDSFGLADYLQPESAPPPLASPPGSAEIPSSEPRRNEEDSASDVVAIDRRPPAPWSGYLLALTTVGLEAEQEALLGLCLGLQIEPARVRTARFTAAVRRWYQASTAPDLPRDEKHFPPARHTGPRPNVAARGGDNRAIAPAEPATPPFESGARVCLASPTDSAPPDSTPAREGHATPVRVETISPPAEGWSESRPTTQVRPEAAKPAAPETGASETIEVETNLGGLFYLVNVGLFLDLYGDFTTPARPGIELPIWDFMSLIGRALLGDDVQPDPV